MSGQAVLGLIPARGGSRRLPSKNLAQVQGRSLIARAVQTGLEAACVDRLIVSTDDPAIAEAARAAGAEVPFMRPAELARDDTPSLAVALHALDWAEAEAPGRYGYLILLQPTSPFRTAQDVDAAFALCRDQERSSAVSVTEADKADTLLSQAPDGRVAPVAGQGRVFALNGAVYVIRTAALRAGQGFVAADTALHLMPPSRSLDVDTAEDLARAREA